MSISPNSQWRGCAANFPQPVNEEDERAAQFLVETVYYFNCRIAAPPLPDIVYRSSSGEEDILRHVFRWDLTPYQEVFRNGFQARRQEGTLDEVYFNLEHYVHRGGRPLDSTLPTAHAFVSTTLNSAWHPSLNIETKIEVYRYEIYAPGGIWIAETLGDRYQYAARDEVCFVAGIAPQYIRSAQLFRLIASTRYTRLEKTDNVIRINGKFNPQSHPSRLLNIRRPIFDCLDANCGRVPLTISIYQPSVLRARETTTGSVCHGYPSLTGTAFAEHGIDCAFGSHNENEAFIFSGNLCAQINYTPGTTNDKIIKGPMTITAVFPSFKGTVFESGVDATFESTKRTDEAYLFKGDSYARINFAPGTTNDYIMGGVKKIFPNWPSLHCILPRKNRGLEVHDHTKPDDDRDHDEL